MKTKYLALLFLLSLLLNAFLGGMMLSERIQHAPMQMGMRKEGLPPMEGMLFKRMIDQSEKLPPEAQKKVATIVGKYQKLYEASGMDDKHHLLDEIQITMTAPKFEKEKIEKIHKELNSSETKFKESIGKMIVELATSLTDKDRITFFQGLFPQRPMEEPSKEDGDRGDHETCGKE